MRIAIIHHQFQKKGGMERYLFDLLHGFSDQNDEIDLFVYKRDKSLLVPRHCHINTKNLNWLPRKLRKYFFARNLSKDFHPDQFDLSLSMMRSTCQDVTVSGGTHPGCLEHLTRLANPFDKLEIQAEKRSFESAKKIIAHSNLVQQEIEEYYNVPREKIVRLFPPINTALFNSMSSNRAEGVAQKYSINKDRVTLLFPSTGHRRKGLNVLLQVMQLLPKDDFELLIAGTPVDSPLSNVRSLGFVEDMPALYAAVDFTLLPSRYEPFGLVVPESIACGTPVIISPFVGAKDIITEKRRHYYAGAFCRSHCRHH